MNGGSSLTGIVETGAIQVTTSYARVELPTDCIQEIRFDEAHELATVSITNGDRISGSIDSETLEFVGVAGTLRAPWKEVAALEIPPESPSLEDALFRPAPTKTIRFEVTLRDGSWVLGTPEVHDATVYGVFGKIRLAWALVEKVTFHSDLETCTLELWSGDTIVGCIDWKALTLTTGLGPVHISTVATEKIELTLGGLDLVEHGYESASGNRYFLGALEHTDPKRIRGRTYPRSQFIEAHASGRVEYAFEEPIREFHAVLAMYESYCATKGKVIFKVETEHGPQYASPPIRNFEQEEVYLRFPPSRKLVLITDEAGSTHEDWSVWLQPEVR